MKVVKTYKLRTQAVEASDFLMSKGIPSNVHGNDIVNSFRGLGGQDTVELEVQDSNYERAIALLKQREDGGISISLPTFDFGSVPWKKKSKL